MQLIFCSELTSHLDYLCCPPPQGQLALLPRSPRYPMSFGHTEAHSCGSQKNLLTSVVISQQRSTSDTANSFFFPPPSPSLCRFFYRENYNHQQPVFNTTNHTVPSETLFSHVYVRQASKATLLV